MKIIAALLLWLGLSVSYAAESAGEVGNKAVAWHWKLVEGKLRGSRVDDKINGGHLDLTGECFQVGLGDGSMLNASDFILTGMPREIVVTGEQNSPTQAGHFRGREVIFPLASPNGNLAAEWHVIARDGGSYLREELVLRAVGQDVLVREIILFNQAVSGAQTMGTVDGSPVAAGSFFLGYEHPMARNAVDSNDMVRCSFARNAILKSGETLTQSCVVGVTRPGQLRRDFLAYLERERAHSYRPFLHYNSWYDIAWSNHKYNESECLDAIHRFGEELVKARGVKMNSFLFDDGWDDNQTLWKFNGGFPDGFTALKKAAESYGAEVGVWLSPFGGYGEAQEQRLKYGAGEGFETNADGFSLAGPKYYQRFQDICLEMVEKYGVNQFKFDGLAAGAKASEQGLTRDGDGMMRLIAALRAAKPDLYINQTTGTWPSPFWLLYVDSTWRGGGDHSFQGKGSWAQKWMTYRDAQTYQNVVKRAPLYPLNSLMLHGLIYAAKAANLTNMTDEDFADQAREFFGEGTQLQEMYVTPALLNSRNWDDLAEAARWSRANADVLVDTHWIGGDPGTNEVYGWAGWSPRKSFLVLRNPDDQARSLTVEARQIFELPDKARGKFVLRSPWKKDQDEPAVVLRAGKPWTFNLRPFELLVLEEKK